jgi:hypothetical protein
MNKIIKNEKAKRYALGSLVLALLAGVMIGMQLVVFRVMGQGQANYPQVGYGFGLPQYIGVVPPASPTVTAVPAPYTTGGSQMSVGLSAATYRVCLTYLDSNADETKCSGYTSVTTTTSNPAFTVTAPQLPAFGVPVSYNIYACSGGSCTSPKLQNAAALPVTQNYTQTASLLTATAPPTANTAFQYSAGNIYLGGGAANSISAGSITLSGGALNNCTAPFYSSCDLLYWTSSGGVAQTATWATATVPGAVLLWAATLDSSNNALTVVPFSIMPETQPVQTLRGTTTWTAAAVGAGACTSALAATVTGIASTAQVTANLSATDTNYMKGLIVYPMAASNAVNLYVCNPTAATLTPTGTALTFNWTAQVP